MPRRADERMFLPGILADVAGDAPRSIYADYLDESPEESDVARAEFIRIQLNLARADDDHPQRPEWIKRQNRLAFLWQSAWAAHLNAWVAGYEFRRGMLDTVCVDARWFCENGAKIFENTAVRKVRFLDALPVIAELAECPALESVRELDLCGNDLGNGGLNILLRSPRIGNLESLDLSFNGLDDGAVGQLGRSSQLPKLAALALNDNRLIGCPGAIHLAESHGLPNLRSLDLSGNDLADAGLSTLAATRKFALRTLRMHANRIGDAGVEALAGSALLPRLLAESPKLDLRDNRIGTAGIGALGSAPALEAARGLNLGGNELRDDGVRALVEGERFIELRRLSIRENRIGDPGARRLANSALMERLDWLDVSGNRISPGAVALLWSKRKDFRTQVESLGQFG